MCACVHVSVCVCAHVCVRVRVCVHMRVCAYACACVCAHVCARMCVCACVCVCVCVRVCVPCSAPPSEPGWVGRGGSCLPGPRCPRAGGASDVPRPWGPGPLSSAAWERYFGQCYFVNWTLGGSTSLFEELCIFWRRWGFLGRTLFAGEMVSSPPPPPESCPCPL